LKGIQEEFQLEIILRLEIDAEKLTKNQIMNILRKHRRKYPIIAIKCNNPEITSWAAQDNRVDIISFATNNISKLFTRSVAKLMVKFSKHLEISLAPLYMTTERTQIPIIRSFKQTLKLSFQKKVPIIVNSGSTSLEQLRPPWELASLAQILSEEKMIPLDSISKIPAQLITQNQKKISKNYLSPGVYRVSNNDLMLQEEEE
jgi:RNase P/RNase MRP subunit p30